MQESRELVFNGDRVSVLEDDKVLEMAGGDGRTTVWMYLMPLNCTLTNGWNSKFYVMYILSQWKFLKNELLLKALSGLPWWRSGWESACQCRGHGFEPWSGKIPHAVEQLGPCVTTTEPARLEPVLHNKRGRYSERPAHRDEEWPPLATTRESPSTEMKTQHSQK